jgi:hypothetical protein
VPDLSETVETVLNHRGTGTKYSSAAFAHTTQHSCASDVFDAPTKRPVTGHTPARPTFLYGPFETVTNVSENAGPSHRTAPSLRRSQRLTFQM